MAQSGGAHRRWHLTEMNYIRLSAAVQRPSQRALAHIKCAGFRGIAASLSNPGGRTQCRLSTTARVATLSKPTSN